MNKTVERMDNIARSKISKSRYHYFDKHPQSNQHSSTKAHLFITSITLLNGANRGEGEMRVIEDGFLT